MARTRGGAGVALGVSVTLAVTTGYVDAVGFIRLLGVFPANQSGNLVFLGMAVGGHGPAPGWRTATAIVGFACGAALGYLLGRRLRGRRRGPALLGLELVLLVAVVVIRGPLHGHHLTTGLEAWSLIVLTSVAMGVQTEVIRHVAGVAVATTYETGTLVRVGEAVSARFGGDGATRGARLLGVLGSVVVAYVAGAALGVTALGDWRWPLLPPIAVLLALAAGWLVRPAWFAAIDDA